jgi:hypothetical protein
MSKLKISAALLVALCFVAGLALAGEGLLSGPQVGQTVPGPFHPLNVTGPDAGQKQCLYCKNGDNPVAMIFAREVSDPLAKLIKKVDTATAQHEDAKMGSFVVFLSDSKDLENSLKELAEKEGIKNTILAIDNPAGPEAYKVAKDADVTVVLYNQHKVKANHAFAKGELKDKDIDVILADVPKILPKESN